MEGKSHGNNRVEINDSCKTHLWKNEIVYKSIVWKKKQPHGNNESCLKKSYANNHRKKICEWIIGKTLWKLIKKNTQI